MKNVLVGLFLLSIAGCSALMERRAAEAVDKVQEAAIYAHCTGITAGGLFRAYGTDPRRLQAWLVLCGYDGVVAMLRGTPVPDVPKDP